MQGEHTLTQNHVIFVGSVEILSDNSVTQDLTPTNTGGAQQCFFFACNRKQGI